MQPFPTRHREPRFGVKRSRHADWIASSLTRRDDGIEFQGICSNRVLFGVVLPTFTNIGSRSLPLPVYFTAPSMFTSRGLFAFTVLFGVVLHILTPSCPCARQHFPIRSLSRTPL